MQSKGKYTLPWQFVVKLCTIEGQVPGRLTDTSHCSPFLRREMTCYLCPYVFCEVHVAGLLLQISVSCHATFRWCHYPICRPKARLLGSAHNL